MKILNSEIRIHNQIAMIIDKVWDGFNINYLPNAFYTLFFINEDSDYGPCLSMEDKTVFNNLGGCLKSVLLINAFNTEDQDNGK